MAKNAVQILKNNWPKVRTTFANLAMSDVLVGVPEEKAPRKGEPMNNATIAYIQDNGAPASGIPARPFMNPGILAVKEAIANAFGNAARAALKGDKGAVYRELGRAGLVAQSSIRAIISAGIDPALKPGTIANRWRSRKTKSKRKGEKLYEEALLNGASPEQAQAEVGIVPLVNTGQLRNSIAYVLRRR